MFGFGRPSTILSLHSFQAVLRTCLQRLPRNCSLCRVKCWVSLFGLLFRVDCILAWTHEIDCSQAVACKLEQVLPDLPVAAQSALLLLDNFLWSHLAALHFAWTRWKGTSPKLPRKGGIVLPLIHTDTRQDKGADLCCSSALSFVPILRSPKALFRRCHACEGALEWANDSLCLCFSCKCPRLLLPLNGCRLNARA